VVEGLVRQVGDAAERINAAQKEYLRLVDVTDAGQDALVKQRVSNLGVAEGPEALTGSSGVEFGSEQVRAERLEGGMVLLFGVAE
jgi:hypothetical protein